MSALARCDDLGDRLLVVATNGAKRNPLSDEHYAVLLEALALAGRERRVTSVLLRGEGGFFCAGGDLRTIGARLDAPRTARVAAIEALHDVIRAVLACPKPVVAVVEGGAAGAGVSLAFACDLIVAEAEATFTAAYVRAGLVPDGGLTHALVNRLPAALGTRLALLGEAVTARRLFALGTIAEIADEGRAFEAAMALTDALARGPSATQGRIKALLGAAAGATLEAQLERERDAMGDAIGSPEAVEGVGAFLAKRVPDFARLRGAPAAREDDDPDRPPREEP